MSNSDVNHHYATHHKGTALVPYDGMIGVTNDGVPVMSNGDELYFSNEPSLVPARAPLCSAQPQCPSKVPAPFVKLGYKWQCVEFVRRYLANRKGVWLTSIPTAKDIWTTDDLFTNLDDQSSVPSSRNENNFTSSSLDVGDIIVWDISEETPFGHVAIVIGVQESKVFVAEQNQGFEAWTEGSAYSREVEVQRKEGRIQLIDEDPVLGWIKVEKPFYDFQKGDIPDAFRIITGTGSIIRKPIDIRVDVPWLNTAERCDYHLKRSLTINGSVDEGAKTEEADVPSGFYYLDYDVFCRIGRAANSLHALAMEATAQVLNDPDAEHLLEHYFGVPKEIQPLLRRSWELTPPLGGRFDFGFDGKRIVMLEYNCDSSGALLEGCDTQQKMANHYGVTTGDSTGSFLSSKCLSYFKNLHSNPRACPAHKLIHFMIDNDDEERYTALCMMNFAEQSGFRCKLCVGVSEFRCCKEAPVNIPPEALPSDHNSIQDKDGEEVLLVWKTWSWDTVLHQYADQKKNGSPGEQPCSCTLSDILLNDHVRVLEPLWKAITGSKAILPYMFALAPDHENMVPASFFPTKEIISTPYISKPVNGRAGQNIIMYDAVTDESTLDDAPVNEDALTTANLKDSVSNSFAFGAQSVDRDNESSPGKFFDSVVVYQQRLFLKKFDKKYFPIFCGWVVDDEFGGVVVREDTSKITKLASVVVPARVVRENVAVTSEEET